ncbi:hypothetical protein OBBRIDRAFT_796334 [Obba rivulosa]|uniref:F-box domain-containing protein n=1 Tax=Obba rivulosa TaxID=1052685 RepID=A0A8E2AV86_9APHY|nr:hypothetical protein OBBRIDRAFT_796334 [Obba rivulosa]
MSLDGYISPIASLPLEVLLDIFAICTECPGDELILLNLASVCRYWREVILNSPLVWQHICLDDRRKIEASHAQARLWLAHSGSLLLDVHVQLTSSDMLLPLLSPLVAYISRWRTCTIAAEREEVTVFSELTAEGIRPHLEQLEIELRGAEDFMGTSSSTDIGGSPTFRSLSSSYTPKRHDVAMHVTMCELPDPSFLCPMRLTTLSIAETSVEVTTDLGRILRFLTALPSLETFHFSGWWPHDGSPMPPDALPVAHLPRLQTLFIRNTCIVRSLLAHIDAPALTILSLRHTNIDFEVRHDTYARIVEEGDSEDEAHDFSQSPWSDRATGMGLRALIRRSNPPLELLDMDYADMRTKDFRWCFDRLDHLREFRIVASDMSDTVIKLLSPYQSTSKCVAEDGSSFEEFKVTRVRLPMLSTLDLSFCQRLSGDAVAAALRSRVLLTDAIADNKTCRTLVHVSIVGCSDFLIPHAVALTPVLGNRLHVS